MWMQNEWIWYCIYMLYHGMSDGGDKHMTCARACLFLCCLEFDKPTQLCWHLYHVCGIEQVNIQKGMGDVKCEQRNHHHHPHQTQTASMSNKSNHIMLIQISERLGFVYNTLHLLRQKEKNRQLESVAGNLLWCCLFIWLVMPLNWYVREATNVFSVCLRAFGI